MSFCEHCEGQRLDRARVLRELRELRRQMRPADRGTCGKLLDQAIKAVKDLDIPHLELIEVGDEIIH